MQKNICPECKTENEPEYRYCKNCGAPIIAPQNTATEHSDPAPEYSAPVQGNSPVGTIDGVPIPKVITFVGKNAHKIVPKFVKLQERNTKVEWCWPPFLWGFFLGPIGVAIWFFYRKMYKHAFIFSAINIILNYISFFAKTILGIENDSLAGIENYFDSFIDTGKFNLQGFLSAVGDRNAILSNLISSFQNVVTFACAIIAGLLGIYIYKKHTVKKIICYTPVSNDPNYINVGLATAGGTSVGAAILAAFAVSLISIIPEFVLMTIRFMGAMYGL